jgi:hypothetical protein
MWPEFVRHVIVCKKNNGRKCSSARAMRELPSAALLYRKLDARSPDRAVLQARNDQLRDGGRGRQHQGLALCGVKDNPPYLHDQRPLTLDDTVEFFNLVPGDKLTARLPTTLLLWVCERSRTSALGFSTRSPSASDKHAGKPASQRLETVRRIRSPPAIRQNLRKAWPSSESSPSATMPSTLYSTTDTKPGFIRGNICTTWRISLG